MGSIQNFPAATSTTDLRVGRRIHCILYGGRDGTIYNVDGEPGQGNSQSAMGGAFHFVRGAEAYVDVVWDNGTLGLKLPECIVTGVQWRFLDQEDRTQAQITDALAHVEIETARAEKLKREKAESFSAAVKSCRENKEFAHLEQTPVGGGYVRMGTLAAKNVRKILKKTFPGVKFSVRQRACDALLVNWRGEDEANADAGFQQRINEALSVFKTGQYNPYEDYHSSSNSPFNVVFGGVDYLICQRAF